MHIHFVKEVRMTFGTGQVATVLGMTSQAVGNLVRDLIPDRPPNQHYRYTPDEVLWLAAYRHARAAGLEAWPARVFVGSGSMRLMLEALLARAAPDPAKAVKRLQNIPILYGARFVFAEAGNETELRGEPLLIEAQRLPSKLVEPCVAAGGAGFANLTTFLTPLAPALNVLGRLIQENANVAQP
jgi:hypothetical protein